MTGRLGRHAGVASATVLLALMLGACGSSAASDRTDAPAGGSTPSAGSTTDTDNDNGAGTANSLDVDVAGSTGAVDGSARPGSDVAASTSVVTAPAASATTTTAKPATATTTTAAAVTTTTAKPASAATTTTATPATTVAAGSTDTLSEAEVAEIEQALDDLDALLDEIDTQLTGL